MSEHGLPDAYITYLADQALKRARAVQQAIDTLTPLERRLLREAAVMGYVRGQMYPLGERLPDDSVMIRDVVESCITNDHRFPLLARLSRGERPQVTEEGSIILGGPDGD